MTHLSGHSSWRGSRTPAGLCARWPAIVIPYEFGGFDGFGEQGIPDGSRRPAEPNPRDADGTTNSLVPLVNLCGVSVCHRPESFKPRAEVFQFAALADAAHQGLAVDCHDSFQHPCDHIWQLAKRLLGRREETLEFGEGRLSRVALEPEGLVAPHRFDAWLGRSAFDGGWQGMRGEGVPFDVDLDESQPFHLERFPGYADRALKASIHLLRSSEALPEEAVALSRVLAVVPAP